MKPLKSDAMHGRVAVNLLMAALLTACGGGSGDSGAGGGAGGGAAGGTPPAPPPSGQYLFYQSGTDGPLMAVDPASPNSPPQQVSSTPISSKALAAIGHGTFDAATNTVSALYTRTIVYAQEGKLWKVSTLKADGLATTQISSETEATSICRNMTATDLTNHEMAAYLYELAGADNDCSTATDNLWRMVRIGMNSSTAPFSAREPITSIDNSATGAHKGWLVDENKALKFYSADFSNSKNVLDTNGQPVSYAIAMAYYGPINIVQEVLRLDGVIGTYTVEDNGGNGNLWKPRASVATNYADSHLIRDSGHLYFADPSDGNPVTTMKILRDQMAIPLATLDGFNMVDDHLVLSRTTSKLILSWYKKSENKTQVMALDKTTGAPSVLTGTAVNGNLRSLITGGDRLYYSFDQGSAYLTDGTTEGFTADPTPQPNLSSGNFDSTTSSWLGAIQPSQLFIGNTPQPQTTFLATNFTAATGFAGGTLTRYDVATATRGTALGTIPAGIKEVQIKGNRTITLANGLRSDGHNDIFLVDVDAAGSLTRITDDATDDIIIDAYR